MNVDHMYYVVCLYRLTKLFIRHQELLGIWGRKVLNVFLLYAYIDLQGTHLVDEEWHIFGNNLSLAIEWYFSTLYIWRCLWEQSCAASIIMLVNFTHLLFVEKRKIARSKIYKFLNLKVCNLWRKLFSFLVISYLGIFISNYILNFF